MTSDSGSPVFLACDWNLIEVLEKLLSINPVYNLNLNPDNKRYTPLSLVVYRSHKAIVELLLRIEKVKVDSKDNNNQISLLWAA